MASEGRLVQSSLDEKDDNCTSRSLAWRMIFKDPNFKDPNEGRVQTQNFSPMEGRKLLMQSLMFPAITHTSDRAEAPGTACHILQYK